MASIDLYRLVKVGAEKGWELRPLNPKSMTAAGLKESGDLEKWLASSGSRLFGREILWIARQDWVAPEQRSDLVGVEKGTGDLVVAELKRGTAEEGAIVQALGYAAEYADKDYNDLLEVFRKNSQKQEGLLVTKEGGSRPA